MDNVVIALGISIAVVLVLLTSCWNPSELQRPRQRPRRRRPRAVDQDMDNPSDYRTSDTGTGLLNANADLRHAELANLARYDDYNSVAQYMGIEKEVYDSHAKYSSDMNRTTSGPSYLSERDDPNDVVSWVGLRKPKYQAVFAGDSSRVDHSENPDQMRQETYYVVG